MSKKFLDSTGLTYLWEKIKSVLNGKVDKVNGKGLSTNDFTTELKEKLEGIDPNAGTITLDNEIKADGENAVTGKTIYTALSKKANSSHTHTITNVTNLQTVLNEKANSTHSHEIADVDTLQTRLDAINDALALKASKNDISSLYKFKGSTNTITAPTNLSDGEVYNVTVMFETTTNFVEGAGKTYPEGTNIVKVTVDGVAKWDVLGSYIINDEALTTDEIDSAIAAAV